VVEAQYDDDDDDDDDESLTLLSSKERTADARRGI